MVAKRDVFVDASPASGVGVFNRRHLFLTTLLCLSPCSAARFKPYRGISHPPFPSPVYSIPQPVSCHPSPVTRHPLSTTPPFVPLFSHPFPLPTTGTIADRSTIESPPKKKKKKKKKKRKTNTISKLNSAFSPRFLFPRSRREIERYPRRDHAVARELIVGRSSRCHLIASNQQFSLSFFPSFLLSSIFAWHTDHQSGVARVLA